MKDYRAGVLVAEIDLSSGDTATDLFALRGYFSQLFSNKMEFRCRWNGCRSFHRNN
jgi:hypothetical protein